MAEFNRRTRTTTRKEWVLRNESPLAEFDKARQSALDAWMEDHQDQRLSDDSVRVTGDGADVILYYDVEQLRPI